MNCDYFYPALLLYNDGQLNGFGFMFNASTTSKRYEKVDHKQLEVGVVISSGGPRKSTQAELIPSIILKQSFYIVSFWKSI